MTAQHSQHSLAWMKVHRVDGTYCEFESHSIALDKNCGFKVFVTQARVDDSSEVLHQHSAREDDSGYSAEDDIP